MKFTKKLGLSIMCIGTGLFGASLEDHSKAHYIGCGTMLGLGLGMLGGTISGKTKKLKKSDDSEEEVDED